MPGGITDNNDIYDKMPSLGKKKTSGRQRFGPKEKARNARGTLLRLLKIYMMWRRPIFWILLLTVLSSVFFILIPYLLGEAINTFNIKTGIVDVSLFRIILFSLLVSYIATWLIDTSKDVLVAKISQELVKHIRAEFFSKLQKVPLGYYDTRPHGDTMSRLTNDVDNISEVISQTTTRLLSSGFSVIGSFVMMLVLSPVLTLIAMVSVPMFVVLTKLIATKSRAQFAGQQRELGRLNGIIEENIVGLKIVKAFNMQETVLKNFRQVNTRLRDYSRRAQLWAGMLMPFMGVINNFIFALIATVGGILILRGSITVGVVVSFISYSKHFAMPLNQIGGMISSIQSALAGAERVFETLDEKEEEPDKPGAIELTDVQGKVEFRNVSFSYEPGRPVLKNISFTVNPGEVVALVGETGAGKTTIVNLLTRFYETDSGKILIDDHDITEITRESLRNCFSVVLQDTFLFSGTIYDNIRYARPESTDAEIKEAACLARADGFISRLPKGYDTFISGNANLSQGQRQLLAIARAILSKAPILILDEATSSVDTKTEKQIPKAFHSLMKNRTSFLIAHRLSTIRDADKIMVISKGEIIESGTHGELMKKKGTYYKMFISQTGIKE